MRCVICKQGETQPGAATVVLQRGETTVVIKDVPADVCETCAEYYLSEEISARPRISRAGGPAGRRGRGAPLRRVESPLTG